MARFRRYRRYRRGYRRWKRWRRARSRYSGSRRIINNSSRTRVSVKCKATQDVSLSVAANDQWSAMLVASPWIANRTITAAAPTRPEVFCAPIVTSPAFTSFAQVYDEVRLTGVRYLINCRSNVGAGGIPSVTFHTCWVRSQPANSYGNTSPNFQTIATSPSAQSVTALNNTVNKFSRSCYPSDLFERIDFVNSQTYDRSLVVNNFAHPPSTAHSDVPVTMTVAAGEDRYESHPSFFPVLYMCADLHSTAQAARTLELNITCYCTFEFRGPKYGNSSSASAALATRGARMDGPAPDAGDDAPPAARAAAEAAGQAAAIMVDDDSDDDVQMLDADEAQEVRRSHHPLPPRNRGVIRRIINGVGDAAAAAGRFAHAHPRVRRRVVEALDAAGVLNGNNVNEAVDAIDAIVDAVNDQNGDWQRWRDVVNPDGPAEPEAHDEL